MRKTSISATIEGKVVKIYEFFNSTLSKFGYTYPVKWRILFPEIMNVIFVRLPSFDIARNCILSTVIFTCFTREKLI